MSKEQSISVATAEEERGSAMSNPGRRSYQRKPRRNRLHSAKKLVFAVGLGILASYGIPTASMAQKPILDASVVPDQTLMMPQLPPYQIPTGHFEGGTLFHNLGRFQGINGQTIGSPTLTQPVQVPRINSQVPTLTQPVQVPRINSQVPPGLTGRTGQ